MLERVGIRRHLDPLHQTAGQRLLDDAVRRADDAPCRPAPRASSPARAAVCGSCVPPSRRAVRDQQHRPRRPGRRPPRAGRVRAAWRARSRRRSAVPSPGFSESSAASTSVRSSVGGIATFAREAKETTPTRNFSGTFSRNAFAAAVAASRRVGSTSSAFIERETSIARTTVASSRGTLTHGVRTRDADEHRRERDEQDRERQVAAAARARGRRRSAAAPGCPSAPRTLARRRSRST